MTNLQKKIFDKNARLLSHWLSLSTSPLQKQYKKRLKILIKILTRKSSHS